VAARILIVDDDKMTRVALEAMFRNDPGLAGVDVTITSAEDGHAALSAIGDAAPDVAVVDLLMPRVDGFATCKALRAHPRGPQIELCVISGVYRDAAIKTRVENELGAKFFPKPDGLRDLIRHVAEVLRRRTSAKLEAVAPRPRNPSPPPVASAAPEPVRNGDLAFRSLAAILLDLHETGASGRLTLRRERVVKTVDLAEGNPVAGASGARDETLGHFLVGAGVITDEQHKAAVTRTVERGEKFGEAMVALGMITPARLSEMLTAQVRHKLVSALRWPTGAWRFAPGPIDETRDGLRLLMVELVLGGLKETSTAELRRAALERVGGAALEVTDRGKKMLGEVRKAFGAKIPDVLLAGGTLADLGSADVDQEALQGAIEALLACDAMTTRLPQVGPGASPSSRSRRNDFRTAESTQAFIARHLEDTAPEGARELYEQLFDDNAEGSGMTPLPEGAAPVEIGEDADSGVIDIAASGLDEAALARQELLKEYLRIQGVDPYAVLKVDMRATSNAISAALAERQSKFSRDYYARFNLTQDQSKLDAILSAYDNARTILLDDARRAALDRELSGGELPEGSPTLDAELAYRAAEDLLARRNFPAAIARLQAAVSAAGTEPDYHAALGWAHWLAGGGDARAADHARPHLNQALALNPEHPAAHEYKGRINAAIGSDDLEALFHLERALTLDPQRTEALAAAGMVYHRRGVVHPLINLIRRVLHHLQGRGPLEVSLHMKLAALHRDHLDDAAGARTALNAARRLAPGDAAIATAIAELDRSRTDAGGDPWLDGVMRWRRDLTSPGPGVELFKWATSMGRHDAAYFAASALVAMGHDIQEAEDAYQRYRPRFVQRAQRTLPGEVWALVRHPDDAPDVGALMELLAPAAHALMPITFDELEVDDSMRVSDEELPDSFRRLRTYLSQLIGVAEPAVYVRTDFGRQVHIGAVAEPVLLCGDDALTNPERAELAFRLARALTFAWPGRAVGGSRPARVLKALTMAVLAEASPHAAASIAAAGDPEGWLARGKEALAALPEDVRAQARSVVVRITSRSPQLNLSRWGRALARTADRVGLLACGDLPAARRFASDGGASDDDLIEFALSPAHLKVRSELGLSIDV
jgi:CheY-like chemotaxis protein/tetratricopeptide (TPR) repeat protein